MSDNTEIEQIAAQWVAREDRGLTDRQSAELSAWLANTAHRVAYLRLKNSWEKSARLAALQHSFQYRIKMPRRSFVRYAMAAAAAIALLGAAGLAVTWPQKRPTQEVIYATQTGERPIFQLADGSQIQMDANSRLRATISDESRTVTLEKGAAYFEVTHDAGRPFVVLAGKHRISDLGTKFSVTRDGDDVRVVVTEGRVQVDNIETTSSAAPVIADGGSIVVAKLTGTLVTPKLPQELTDELDWRQGRLTFNQVTLSEAAEGFNRYNSRKLVVTSGARDIRIGGSFRADNLDSFVALVRTSLGLTVSEQGNTITLSKN